MISRRHGKAGHNVAGLGSSCLGRLGMAQRVEAGRGMADAAWNCVARQAWRGAARHGRAVMVGAHEDLLNDRVYAR